MASVEKLPSGNFSGVYRDAAGKKRRVKGTFDRKTDAREAAQEAEVKARRQAAVRAGTLSARTAWGEWWDIHNSRRSWESDNGHTEDNIVRNYLLPRWGGVPLNAITHRAVQGWIDDIKSGRAPSYVQRIYSVFRVSMTAAVDAEVLNASPCVGVRVPKRQKRSKPYASVEDAERLGGEMPECYRDAVEFALETGLRPGELTGLHAHRVDLGEGWLIVAETYVFRQKRMRPWPKDRDERLVPLSSRAVEIVKRRLAGRDLSSGCGLPHIGGEVCRSPLVFLGVRGGTLNRDILNFHLRNAADSAGLVRKSGYSLRRGFITRAAEGGLDVFTLADIVGHADVNQTKEYFQKTPTVRSRTLAALGERPALAAVEDVGRRGTGRGTDSPRMVTPESSTAADEDAG